MLHARHQKDLQWFDPGGSSALQIYLSNAMKERTGRKNKEKRKKKDTKGVSCYCYCYRHQQSKGMIFLCAHQCGGEMWGEDWEGPWVGQRVTGIWGSHVYKKLCYAAINWHLS